MTESVAYAGWSVFPSPYGVVSLNHMTLTLLYQMKRDLFPSPYGVVSLNHMMLTLLYQMKRDLFPSPYGVVSLNLYEKNDLHERSTHQVSVPLRGSQFQSEDVRKEYRNLARGTFPSPYGVVSFNHFCKAK